MKLTFSKFFYLLLFLNLPYILKKSETKCKNCKRLRFRTGDFSLIIEKKVVSFGNETIFIASFYSWFLFLNKLKSDYPTV